VLNLYTYPAAIDYLDARPLGDRWHRIQSSVRTTDATVEVPAHILDGPGSLVYLSLGSLGGADVELMKRLTGFLADTEHRFIVSKGPRADEYDLPDNMWGAGMVPQTTLIGQCDLVVTHGGNNTICEAFHFGKPTVVLPLFWDQYDNAQRVDETGLGRRLDTYRVGRDELVGAIDALLGDRPLQARMAAIGEQVRAENGVQHAAATIAEVGRRHRDAR
jgi:UDP:flavonoid glycosyltransferase YjiC (YdhE family)